MTVPPDANRNCPLPPQEVPVIPVQDAVEASRVLWHALCEGLEQRFSLFVFRGFIQPLMPVRLDDGLFTLAAPSPFHRDWVRDHYASVLEEETRQLVGARVRVSIVHDPRIVFHEAPQPTAERAAASFPDGRPQPDTAHLASAAEPNAEAQVPSPRPSAVAGRPAYRPLEASASVLRFPADRAQTSRTPPRSRLNPAYTFDDFVRGPTNEMAFAACRAVAEHPAEKYSPLFLFGGVGLGKTHLLHAIGNEALRLRPDLRVVYMSAEAWVNEYIHDIRNQRFDEFRRKYRAGCDILLLDDIQFLAGKDASQDEFFHTFNSLHENHRQIVVTSDRYPHEIEGLEERLKTRLQWGLIADVRPPELETRLAILQHKAARLGMVLSEDIQHFLAGQIQRSVRELEGALVRLNAFATLSGRILSLDEVKTQLAPMLGHKVGALHVERIMQVVSGYFDLRPSELKGKSRQRQVARARQIAMYLARQHTECSLPEIGRAFGGRDHTTVLTSVRKITGLRANDAGVQAVIGRLEKALLDPKP